jgi:hypothetical protein
MIYIANSPFGGKWEDFIVVHDWKTGYTGDGPKTQRTHLRGKKREKVNTYGKRSNAKDRREMSSNRSVQTPI